jgi:hypothetical protein
LNLSLAARPCTFRPAPRDALQSAASTTNHQGITVMVSRFLGLALIIAGAVLGYFAWQATDSLGEQLVEGVTGKYSDSTMTYIIAAIICGVVGIGLLVAGKK